jgi:hypothetical protein
MRVLDPFAYFADHASALAGFGGTSLGPDPRYFLHTSYEDVKPGRAIFRMRLDGAAASGGELTFRVHSHKPETNVDVTLVASTRLRLEQVVPTQEGSEIEIAMRIAAIEGVRYALYGYFSEPSDLTATDVSVVLEELGPDHEIDREDGERPVSDFRPDTGPSERRQLVSRSRPTLTSAESRDCTRYQLERIGAPADHRLAEWRRRVARTVLEGHRMLDAGASGLVRGRAPDGLVGSLAERDCAVHANAPADGMWYDFVVSYELEDAIMQAEHRFETVRDVVGRLMHGGLAVIFLAYDANSPALTGESGAANRNELGHWALAMVGAGHWVAPMAFGHSSERAVRPDGLTPFVLVVRHG